MSNQATGEIDLERRLREALVILEKIAPTMMCDSLYSGDCSACDVEDFIRITKEELETIKPDDAGKEQG